MLCMLWSPSCDLLNYLHETIIIESLTLFMTKTPARVVFLFAMFLPMLQVIVPSPANRDI